MRCCCGMQGCARDDDGRMHGMQGVAFNKAGTAMSERSAAKNRTGFWFVDLGRQGEKENTAVNR